MASTTSDLPVRARGLRKCFGRTVALDGLDLEVRAGEVHGFLGPNGSGKSTTIRILLGLLRADGGEVALLGGDPWRNGPALHRRLAYVPGDVSLWPELTGGEVIDLLGRLQGGHDPARRAELLDMFELDPTKKSRSYSKGNRQKVALVAALASDAPLLILDEPTSGLDPLMEEVFQAELAELRAQGRTVLLSSHILSEVERACDRVSIVRSGRIVDSGSLADLRHLTRTRVHAVLRDAVAPADVAGWAGIHDIDLVSSTASGGSGGGDAGSELSCSVDSAHLGDLVEHLGRRGVLALTCQPPTLEELFLARYREPSP